MTGCGKQSRITIVSRKISFYPYVKNTYSHIFLLEIESSLLPSPAGEINAIVCFLFPVFLRRETKLHSSREDFIE
jgi:hypothetical protein